MRIIRFLLLTFFIISPSTSFSQEKYLSRKILGRTETVVIENKIRLDAKMDTGADMSSLSATKIKFRYEHSQKRVQFTLIDTRSHQMMTLDRPLLGFVRIKKRREETNNNFLDKKTSIEYGSRPIVNVRICIDNERYVIKTNLIDRRLFDYPMILGVDAIQKINALIDVNQHEGIRS